MAELVNKEAASTASIIEHEKHIVLVHDDPSRQVDPYLVEFKKPVDAKNPKDWPLKVKWMVTAILSVTGFNRIMVSTIMAPALSVMQHDLDMNNIETVMAMSVYLLASAFGPLIIGPLSELYGRKPLIHATNVWFLLWNIACGFARTKTVLITARLLAGLGASAVYSLGSAVLGDVWRPEERGRSLGFYLLIPLLGAAIGPILGGFITVYTNWRWMFWSTAIFQAILTIASIILFRETHDATILKRKARTMRDNTGNASYHTKDELLGKGKSSIWVLQRSLSRPLRLLLFHPIIQIQAVLSAFEYGLLYFALSSFAELFINQYHQKTEISGLHYVAIAIGEVAAAQTVGPLMDKIFRRLKSRNEDVGVAEYRAPLMLPGAVFTPLGLLVYGWAADKQLHWGVVDIGVLILSFGMQTFGTALQAYIIDSYPDHVGSVSAATQLLRSLTAFAFPLFAPKMYQSLGYGWGNSLLAFSAIAVFVPAPLLIWTYGSRFRARARSSY